MEKKQMLWKTKGMNKDLSVSAFNPDFAFENMNLRLSTNEHNTLLSWVNEKGTEKIDLYTKVEGEDRKASIQGTPIGTAVIDHQFVVFTTSDNWDYIYTIHKEDAGKMVLTLLYSGHLNFSTSNPLETLVSYEMDTVEKVYWVDGRNQPRVINIKGKIRDGVNTQFDFVPALELKEEVVITQSMSGGGIFAPGVIQYAITYINKYGQESNIVYVSPLQYLAYSDRGASPEEKISCSFNITVSNPDEHFDYLRLYSIHRSSLNGEPFVRLVEEFKVSNGVDITYRDFGVTGSSVDPVSLLFIGGKEITALTMIDKDKTLFLGAIEEKNSDISNIQGNFPYEGPYTEHPRVQFETNSNVKYVDRDPAQSFYSYQTQLGNNKRQITTFKGGEIYRLGFQLQKKTGEWSEPILLGDYKNNRYPESKVYQDTIPLSYATATLSSSDCNTQEYSYKKIRPVVVYPSINNRQVICQGVLNPTVFNVEDRKQKLPFAQASWYFRPYVASTPRYSSTDTYYPFTHYESLQTAYTYTNGELIYDFADENINKIEVQGSVPTYASPFSSENNILKSNTQFFIDQSIVTLNSPDIDFDTEVQSSSMEGLKLRIVGAIPITGNVSSHKMAISSAMVGMNLEVAGISSAIYGSGENDYNALLNNISIDGGSHLSPFKLWNDSIIRKDRDTYSSAGLQDYDVFPWQRTGSLNNDTRGADVASSWLKNKKESNLLYSINSEYFDYLNFVDFNYISTQLHLTENNYITNLRLPQQKSTLSAINYYPNIDKVLVNENGYKVSQMDDEEEAQINMGKAYSPISMKYKSTSHAVIALNHAPELPGYITGVPVLPYSQTTGGTYIGKISNMSGTTFWGDTIDGFIQEYKDMTGIFKKDDVHQDHNWLWLGELYRNITNPFGGTDRNAILANNWVVGGDAVDLPDTYDNNTTVTLKWTEGDTYFQRYDCLKTYAFTPEDTNQLVEILSFMVETHVNLDGRYDKNRGQQISYLMSPENFNLINDVYSQKDNFFSYKKADIDATSKKYPNQIAYTLTKTSGADVDAWTNMSLGSTLELDGDKGSITKLIKLNDKLLAFQDSGISQIMYNENVQVSTEQGVPIEIANSGKVQGARYLSNTVGCSNKWSVVQTPSGIYFMDSNDKSIYLLGDGLKNITEQGGFNTWAKQNISTYKTGEPLSAGAFKAFYDRLNQEVLYINKDTALAWSEKIGAFTSFYDYGNAPYFVNLDDEGYWLNISQAEPENTEYKLWKHQGGEYCNFFDVNKDYYTILIGNPQPQADKIFTNLEFRACVGDGESQEQDSTLLPFDSLETWNEYQHGETKLHYNRMPEKHFQSNSNALNRKFRIWRCDIPRDGNRKLDRMRNPWLYLKLMKNKTDEGTLPRVEIHDVGMNYFV